LTSLYDENKLYVSYVQPKFTKVSTVWNCLPPSVNYSTLATATFRHSSRPIELPYWRHWFYIVSACGKFYKM